MDKIEILIPNTEVHVLIINHLMQHMQIIEVHVEFVLSFGKIESCSELRLLPLLSASLCYGVIAALRRCTYSLFLLRLSSLCWCFPFPCNPVSFSFAPKALISIHVAVTNNNIQ